jgi:hypothetical protein
MVDWRVAYKVLRGRTGEKRPLGRSRRRWEDNIKIYVQEVRWAHGLD